MRFLVVILFSLLLLICGCSDDDGVGPGDESGPLQDLVRIESVNVSPASTAEVKIYMENTVELAGLVLPLTCNGDYINLDSVTYSQGRFADLSQVNSYIYSAQNQVVLTAFFDENEIIDTGRGNIFVLHLTVAQSSPLQEVVIDTAFIAPAGRLAFYNTTSQGFVPSFEKGILAVR